MTNTPKPAQWCTEPGDNHSSDRMTVHRGDPEPARLCGYHALRQELAAEAERRRRVWTRSQQHLT